MLPGEPDPRRLLELYEFTSQLVSGDGGLESTVEAVLDASTRLLDADMGNLQVYDPEANALRLVAHRGFPGEFIEYFRLLPVDREESACGVAYRRGERVIVEDVPTNDLFARNREVMAGAGVVTMQSTPLLSRGGEVMGVISTHFRETRALSSDELHILDLYAGAAADAIERDQTQRRLQEAEAVKDDFLSMVSHELKSPLTSVLGFARMLHRRRDAIGTELAHDAMETLLSQAERMDAMLSNMLVLARLDTESVELEPVRLSSIVESTADEVRRQDAGIDVQIEESLIVSGRPQWIRQILWNLLNNAAKYGEPGEEIELRVERAGNEAVVRVLDGGQGIDPESLERVFTPFFRGDHSTSHAPGIGIGLTVCKRLTEVQGGCIELAPRAGGGIEARVTLPLESDAAPD